MQSVSSLQHTSNPLDKSIHLGQVDNNAEIEEIRSFAEFSRNSFDRVRPELLNLTFLFLINIFANSLFNDGGSIHNESSSFSTRRSLLSEHIDFFDDYQRDIIRMLLRIVNPDEQLYGCSTSNPEERRRRLLEISKGKLDTKSQHGYGGTISISDPLDLISSNNTQTLSSDAVQYLAPYADSRYQAPIELSTLSKSLAIDFLERNGHHSLLSVLAARIKIQSYEYVSGLFSQNGGLLKNPAASSLKTPVIDVVSGLLTSAARKMKYAPNQQTQLQKASDSLQSVIEWGAPLSVSGDVFHGKPHTLLTTVPLDGTKAPIPDYRRNAFSRATLAGAVNLPDPVLEPEAATRDPTAFSLRTVSLDRTAGALTCMSVCSPLLRLFSAAELEDRESVQVPPPDHPIHDYYLDRVVAAGFSDGTFRAWIYLNSHASEHLRQQTSGSSQEPSRTGRASGHVLPFALESDPVVAASQGPVLSVALSPCFRFALCGHTSGAISLFALGPAYLREAISALDALAESSSSSSSASASIDTQNVSLLKPLAVYAPSVRLPTVCVAFSPLSPAIFVAAARDAVGRLYSTAFAEPQRVLVGHTAPVLALCWHPNGLLLATAAADRAVRLWSPAAGDCLALYAVPSQIEDEDLDEAYVRPSSGAGTPRVLRFSPSGRFLAAGFSSGAVALWEVASGTLLRLWPSVVQAANSKNSSNSSSINSASGGVGVRSVAFSTDGRLLAAVVHNSRENARVAVWSIEQVVLKYDAAVENAMNQHLEWQPLAKPVDNIVRLLSSNGVSVHDIHFCTNLDGSNDLVIGGVNV